MARLLLDTHIILWWLGDNPKLSKKAKTLISEASVVYVSSVSAWEIAIKKSLGKLECPDNFEETILADGFNTLPLLFSHAKTLLQLPLHHDDPFDRMLVAQAKTEKMTLLTHDKIIGRYDIHVIFG